MDALICLPTLGIGCWLAYFNAKAHEDEYNFLLEEEKIQPTQAEPAPTNTPPIPVTEPQASKTHTEAQKKPEE